MTPTEENYNNSTPATDVPRWVWLVAAGIVIIGVIIGGIVLYERRSTGTPTDSSAVISPEGNLQPVADNTELINEPTVVNPNTEITPVESTGTVAVDITIDTDGDTIPDAVETYIGTDPTKADTDGDGYNDGEEIKNGYNPFGPGKLKITL